MKNKNFLSIKDISKFENELKKIHATKPGFFTRIFERINNLFSFNVWATNKELTIAVIKIDKAENSQTKGIILQNFQQQIDNTRRRMMGTSTQNIQIDDQQVKELVQCAKEVIHFSNGRFVCSNFIGVVNGNAKLKNISNDLMSIFNKQLEDIINTENNKLGKSESVSS